jgi:hypothetical protein
MLTEIHELSIRAILGGFLIVICSLIALSVSYKNNKIRQAIYVTLIGAVAIVSGILLATSLYVAQNPPVIQEVTLP